jgi:hypothetical protein
MGGHFVDGCVRVQVATPVQGWPKRAAAESTLCSVKVAKRLCVTHRVPPQCLVVCFIRAASYGYCLLIL